MLLGKSGLRTRLAPTPSGFLHLGNAYSFVLTWLTARRNGGIVVLRIDDLDGDRKRPEYVADIFQSLEWLGLTYDEGPTGPDQFERQFSQHCRLELYQEALQRLVESGQVFGCECSRNSIRNANADGRHPDACQNRGIPLSVGGAAWRIATPHAEIAWQDGNGTPQTIWLDRSMKDFVVRRKDRIPSYQVASLVDDSFFEIDTIVRGSDLLESTASQRFLAEMLDYRPFLDADFYHHPLIQDDTGAKLSKSEGAESLYAMRQSGLSAEAVFRRLSPILGLKEPVISAEHALEVLAEQI